MLIEPGDLILGDWDGLVVVPFDAVDAVYKAATTKNDAETKQMADIEAGTNDRSWIDKSLDRLGCEYVR